MGGWSNLQSGEGNVQIVNLLCSDAVGVSGPQMGPTLTEPLGKGGVCQGVTDSHIRAVGSEVISFQDMVVSGKRKNDGSLESDREEADGIHRTVCKYFTSMFSSSRPFISDLENASKFINCRMDSDMLAVLNAHFDAFEDGQYEGNKQLISVQTSQIRKFVNNLGRLFFLSRLFDLEVQPEFGSSDVIGKVRVLPKLLHLHAEADVPLNVTLLRAPSQALLKVNIPFVFRGEDALSGLRKCIP
ncbi:hypothetical protein ACOSQ2_014555 [Xanthoceras sorbifolium]